MQTHNSNIRPRVELSVKCPDWMLDMRALQWGNDHRDDLSDLSAHERGEFEVCPLPLVGMAIWDSRT